MRKPIKYKDVIDLGFIREEGSCNVHFDQYGTGYFWCRMKLGNKIEAHWEQTTRLVELQRMGKKGTILSRMPITDLNELKKAIKFFKK